MLDRIFRKNPGEELVRAEELLTVGRAYDALVTVQGVEERAGKAGGADAPALRLRARDLEVRAREVLIGSALAEADLAEADEDYDEAAEWVGSAMAHAARAEELSPGAGAPADLRRRRDELQMRGREASRQSSLLDRFEEDEPSGPDPLEVEHRFGILVGSLHEEVADLYLHRPLPFQQAYIDLDEGRFEAALATLGALAADDPGDAVVRFERGRARLALGDFAGAREDFEAAWDELGDEPLDEEGRLSVPALMAQAAEAL